jgi:hypothetical protein
MHLSINGHRRRAAVLAGAAAGGVLYTVASGSALAAPPHFDHVVIVIEENHAQTQIIGNSAQAPYINGLANAGVSFNNFFAITHPSQPNYLEFFSGSAQGVTSDTTATNVPFTTPNLGAAVRAAGFSFAGYSESQPSVGYTGDSATTVSGQNQYMRKHNPWVNWQSASPSGNLLPTSVNQPYTGIPADFSTLPALSFVVPNEQDDMHDGTIAQADTWLQNNLGAYNTWAKAHNSLLIVTWDEDNSANNNRIPTIFSGANLKNGTTSNTSYTLHNLLRTVGDTFGAAPSGSAAGVKDITGVFAGDAAQSVASFQQGVNGYVAAHDTEIRQDSTSSTFGATTPLVVDQDDNTATGNQPVQALVRFDNIIGSGAGQVPAGATILSAKLNIHTGSTTNDNTGGSVELHRMLTSWTESSTWGGSFGGNGVDANGVDASSAADFTLTPNELDNGALFDVTGTVQAWANGSTNFGWSLLANSTDGWRFDSSEFGTLADRPSLEITYAVPEPSAIGLLTMGVMLLGRRRWR